MTELREAAGQSYEQLFRTQFPGLVRLAGLLGAEDPENIVQESFVRLHAALPRLRDDDATLAYVRRTVVNLSRSGSRRRAVAERWRPALWAADVEPAEDTAIRQDDARLVLAALHRLSREHREVLIFRYWGRLSVAETAASLGISDGTVKSRTSRALHALAVQLGEGR